MKKLIPTLLTVACLLALAGDASAFGRLFSRSRSVQKVVVKQEVQQVKVQQVKVVQQVQVQKVQKVVVQPVYAVQSYGYAVQVQPVQAYYSVQSVQSYGYGSGVCSQNSLQIRELQRQVQQLQATELQRLEAERQRLQGVPPMVVPPK